MNGWLHNKALPDRLFFGSFFCPIYLVVSYMSFQGRKRVPGQFGLPAIGESLLDLTVTMQWPLIIEIIIEDRGGLRGTSLKED